MPRTALERAARVPHREPGRAQPAPHDPRAEHRARARRLVLARRRRTRAWSASRSSHHRAAARVLSPMPEGACRLLAERITPAAPERRRRSRHSGRVRGALDRVPLHRGHRDRRATAVRAHEPATGRDPRPAHSAPPARDDRPTLVEWTHAFVDELDLHPRTRRPSSTSGSPPISSGSGTTTVLWPMASRRDPRRVGVAASAVRVHAARATRHGLRDRVRRAREPRARSTAACAASCSPTSRTPTVERDLPPHRLRGGVEILGYDFA